MPSALDSPTSPIGGSSNSPFFGGRAKSYGSRGGLFGSAISTCASLIHFLEARHSRLIRIMAGASIVVFVIGMWSFYSGTDSSSVVVSLHHPDWIGKVSSTRVAYKFPRLSRLHQAFLPLQVNPYQHLTWSTTPPHLHFRHPQERMILFSSSKLEPKCCGNVSRSTYSLLPRTRQTT